MGKHEIAVIPGDGVGAEVIRSACQVLDCLCEVEGNLSLSFTMFDWNSLRYLRDGRYLPIDGLDQLKQFDAILFGSVGSQDVADHISLWGLRLAICQGLDQYANIRPARLLPGIVSPLRDPTGLDWIIVRENSEGEYSGHGGRSHQGSQHEVATETAVFSRRGVERIQRFAFELARSRPTRRLTLVTKSNAQRFGLVMWDDVFYDVAQEYPEVQTDRELVDAMTARMVSRPASLDVIVATNLHADILSDLAAALAGGLGLAPTANLNPERRFPSMFEPIHGSAFDIVGKGIANPIGALWSSVMMLNHLRELDAARRLMGAIEAVARRGPRTPDLKGNATTTQITDAICALVESE